MNVARLLDKKRRGNELSDQEIRFFVDGFCEGSVADYQMSALAMAICLNGMTPRETAALTLSMLESGDRLDRGVSDQRDRPRVDKHSTGGLGDKVSLILAPLLAACGMDVPMISGRGLGITGGTLDKLESIPGYRCDLSSTESSAVLRDVGTFIAGATHKIAPADKQMYALRDVTGTVESVALITSSILSKKLAASLDALVMDVKVGHAAFMKNVTDATTLAESLVRVGGQAGLPTSVILSDMDQPLGAAVGNAIEVNEAMNILKGGGPPEVRTLTLELSANLLVAVNAVVDRADAMARLAEALDSGTAFEVFQSMVRAQGGVCDARLPLAPQHDVLAQDSGYIASFDCESIGGAVIMMGGGRRKVEDVIDPSVGLNVHVRIGDRVEKGQPIFSVFCNKQDVESANECLERAFQLSTQPVEKRELMIARMSDSTLQT